jgi:hypothetical protein
MPNNRKIPGTHRDEIYKKKLDEKQPVNLSITEHGNMLQPPPGKNQDWHNFFWHTVECCKLLGIDSASDIAGIVELCDVWQEINVLKKAIQKDNGEIDVTDIGSTGQTVVSAEYKALLSLRPHYHKLLAEFGMTPRGRAYVYDKRKTVESKAAAILNQLNED